jgi:hypothetical protein
MLLASQLQSSTVRKLAESQAWIAVVLGLGWLGRPRQQGFEAHANCRRLED